MRKLMVILFLLTAHAAVLSTLSAQTSPEQGEKPAADVDLSNLQQQLFRDYERFEKSLYDVAEQARSKDPERSELLYRARSQSQEASILSEMQTITELLRATGEEGKRTARYGPAADRQKELLARLEVVLKLLQSLDERERLEAEIERIQGLLKDTNRVLALQKDARADTSRARKETEQLKNSQQRVADEADKLKNKIEDQDRKRREEEDQSRGEGDEKPDDRHSDDQKPDGERPDGEKSEGEDSDGGKGDSEGDSESEGKSDPGQKESSEEPPAGSESEGDQKSGSESSEDQSEGSQQPAQGGGEQQPTPEGQEQQSPGSQQTPGREELEQARREMQQAIEKLEQEQRDKAVDDQDEAVAKLEEMKARLEEILRQLREEEKESYLTLLEARFQNMLNRQKRINSETVRLDEIPEKDRAQQSYASQTDTIRKEQNDNAIDAEKALNLLKQEGSSVAFPEAVDQMHRNMRVVEKRLAGQNTGKTTQVIERMIVETLEEMIAAFQKELEKQEDDEQSPPGEEGQPQDPSLVDQIAELKMIRSLQNQVNRLTQEIGTEIEGKIATDPDQLGIIEDLAQRQQRLQKATYDLSVGRNR